MRGELSNIVRLRHILGAIYEVEIYISESNFEIFLNDSMMKFACMKQLEIVGEAANHLTINLIEKYNHINWKGIVGLRNRLVHEYFGISPYLTWEILKNEIPTLRVQIQVILLELESENK